MKKVYCCKEGGKRFGKTCLTNGFRGSNGFCKYASEIHPLDWVNRMEEEFDKEINDLKEKIAKENKGR